MKAYVTAWRQSVNLRDSFTIFRLFSIYFHGRPTCTGICTCMWFTPLCKPRANLFIFAHLERWRYKSVSSKLLNNL